MYNRRHFGVLTTLVALTHLGFVLDWYYAFSRLPASRPELLLTSSSSYDRLLGFPFEAFGIFALIVLLILATTSHDFWLKFLTPRLWKRLHILIYPAYAAVLAHIALGALQDQTNFGLAGVTLFFCDDGWGAASCGPPEGPRRDRRARHRLGSALPPGRDRGRVCPYPVP